MASIYQNDMTDRDIEKTYTRDETIKKLERLVECLKENRAYEIQVAGERIYIPADVEMSIEHEREDGEEELEFQFKWPVK